MHSKWDRSVKKMPPTHTVRIQQPCTSSRRCLSYWSYILPVPELSYLRRVGHPTGTNVERIRQIENKYSYCTGISKKDVQRLPLRPSSPADNNAQMCSLEP